MSHSSDRPRVLVVDDEKRIADTYRLRLDGTYDVDSALGGREALETVGDDHDVVLLDRRMPDISGDEVLDEIRSRDLDCKVVMVTAVDPDFDIVEMACDDYIVKPVDEGRLLDVVDRVREVPRARWRGASPFGLSPKPGSVPAAGEFNSLRTPRRVVWEQ